MKYRPEIDGLRAIAVISVILFHAGVALFKGGFVGVDIFFVISGYLITTIILEDLQGEHFSLLRFYERRIRRIIPMVTLITLVSLLIGWLIYQPSDMRLLSKSLIAVTTFSSNVLFLQESNYWSLANEYKPLAHTWSLAVEEQFYLCYPLVLIALHRLRKSLLLGGLIIITAASFLISLSISQKYPGANFYLLPSRVWELTLGGIIAIIQLQYPKNYQLITSQKSIGSFFSLLGLTLIVSSLYFLDETFTYPGIWTVLPNLGTVFVIVFCNEKNLAGRLLSRKSLVHLGLVSYSAYLWHQPIFAFLRYTSTTDPNVGYMMFSILMIYPLSVISWKFVEQTFRNRDKISSRQTIISLGTFCCLLVTIGFFGYKSQGFPNRAVVKDLQIEDYIADNRILHRQSWQPLQEKSKETGYTKDGNPSDQTLWFDLENTRKKVLLVGNSHSKDLYNVLMASRHFNTSYQLARFGTEIKHLGDPDNSFYSSPNYRTAEVIVIISRYDIEDLKHMKTIIEKLQSDKKPTVIVENIFEFEQFGIHTIADFYVQKSVLRDEVPVGLTDLIAEINEIHYDQYVNSTIMSANRKIRELVAEHDHVLILDRMKYICDHPTKRCFAISETLEKYFYDYSHHTLTGATSFGQRIDSIGWLSPLDSMTNKTEVYLPNTEIHSSEN